MNTILKDQLRQVDEELAAKVPQDKKDIMARNTQALIESGLAQRAAGKGDNVPLFSLENSKGEMVSSGDLFNRGPVVMSFFRGFW